MAKWAKLAPQDRTKEDDIDLGWDDEQEIDSGWGSENGVAAAPEAPGAEPVRSADAGALSPASDVRPPAPHNPRGRKERKERQRAKAAEKSRRQKERAAAATARQKKPKQREEAVRTRASVEPSDREAGGREGRSPGFARSDARSEPTRGNAASRLDRVGARRAKVPLVVSGVLVILAIATAIGVFVARR